MSLKISLHLDSSVKSELSFDGKLKYLYSKKAFTKCFSGSVSQDAHYQIERYGLGLSKMNLELTFEEPISVKPHQDHTKAFLEQLSHLRRDSSLADITLVSTVDGKEFPVHKSILSARSTVFAAMFSHSQLQENQNRRVNIEDISGDVLEALLKYIYECDIKGIEPIEGDLLAAANKYDIPLLVDECAQSMANNCDISKAAYYFYLANLHQLEELKTQIGQFMVENKAAVRQSDGFKEFIQSDNGLLLQFIDLVV